MRSHGPVFTGLFFACNACVVRIFYCRNSNGCVIVNAIEAAGVDPMPDSKQGDHKKPDRNIEVRHRGDQYAEHYRTAIWSEINDHDNPFIDTDALCHGYPLEQLVAGVSYPEMIFLMLKGDLPSESELVFLNRLLVAFSHPGVRHDATRAGVQAGVGKTLPSHCLPIALLVYGGDNAAGRVEDCMRFFTRSRRKPVASFVEEAQKTRPPGFDAYYASVDVMAGKIAGWLCASELATPSLDWAVEFAAAMTEKGGETAGWTRPAIAAAAFCDLGFRPRYGPGLLQMMAAPGLLVQGMEHANKPATVLPFVDDADYGMREEALGGEG